MFSYRHAFHAGNHADVLKHAVFLQLIDYLQQKDTPIMAIDTHAGAGVYALDAEHATRSGEAETGIVKLWERKDLPPMLARYVDLIRALNPSGRLRYYPGSPYCAEKVLREEDRLRLFELHSTDIKLLEENFRKLDAHAAAQGKRPAHGKRVMIARSDGYQAMKALLPPPSRRGLVLIDPPYEDKDDYRKVRIAIEEALARFSTGVYAVWYPLIGRHESHQLPDRLKRLSSQSWLNVTLTVAGPSQENQGLRSSGMFVINPPWTLEPALRETMPYLVSLLGTDAGAGFTIETGQGAPSKAPPKPAGTHPEGARPTGTAGARVAGARPDAAKPAGSRPTRGRPTGPKAPVRRKV